MLQMKVRVFGMYDFGGIDRHEQKIRQTHEGREDQKKTGSKNGATWIDLTMKEFEDDVHEMVIKEKT